MNKLVLPLVVVAAFGIVSVPVAAGESDNPVLGKWRVSANDGSCTERHQYHADGLAAVYSGDEILMKSYRVERYQGGPYYLVQWEIVGSNGGRDCTGKVTEVGSLGRILVLPTRGGGFSLCVSTETGGCVGTATRDDTPAEAD